MPKNKFLKLTEADAKAFYANGSITKNGVTYNVSDGIIPIVENEGIYYAQHDVQVNYTGGYQLHFLAQIEQGTDLTTFADFGALWQACGIENGWAKPFCGYANAGYTELVHILTLEDTGSGIEITHNYNGATTTLTLNDADASSVYIDGNPVAV